MWEKPVCTKLPNFLYHGIDKQIHQKLFQIGISNSDSTQQTKNDHMCEGHFWPRDLSFMVLGKVESGLE